MKYAIISDIHGNMTALQQVLQDAKEHGAEQYIFLGDYFVSLPWPEEVLQFLQTVENAYIIKGNEEQYLHVPEGDDGQFEISRWCKHQLTQEQITWVDELPEQLHITDAGVDIYMAHASSIFLGDVEFKHFGPGYMAEHYEECVVPHKELLKLVDKSLDGNDEFEARLELLPKGIYLFGHGHVQWYRQTDNHLFVNPGSCGLPLDCEEFGAPYTLLTVENGEALVEERRVQYSFGELVEQVKASGQYKEARVWSEVIFKELEFSRDKIFRFLEFVEAYANRIGDERRPFAKETWEEAYQEWKAIRPTVE